MKELCKMYYSMFEMGSEGTVGVVFTLALLIGTGILLGNIITPFIGFVTALFGLVALMVAYAIGKDA